MKRIIICSKLSMFALLALLFILPIHSHSQERNEVEQEIRLLYIAKDNDVPQDALTKILNASLQAATREKSPILFYYADGESPFVVKFNFEDEGNDSLEPLKDFDLLKRKIQTGIPDLNGPFDHKRLLSLIRQYHVFSDSGKLLYKRLNLIFCVGKTFWVRQYYESVIASIFFELNLGRLQNDEFSLRVYAPKTADIDQMYPFGTVNPDEMNRFSVQNY